MSQDYLASSPLRPGDRVAVIAPSSPFDREAFGKGLDRLRSRYEVTFDEGIYGADRFFAGSDADRLRMLQNALDDDGVRGIFCARGGYGAMRLLPGLRLPERPKPLIGFSDITALHLAFQAKGWRSLHGPVLTQLGRLGDDAVQALFQTLEAPETPSALSGRPVREGSAEGVVLGGNLSVLTRLLGTPFMPDMRGAILFIEDVGERPYRLDRMMAHLSLAGVLSSVAGVALGAFTDCDDARFRGEEVVLDFLKDLGVPVVAGLPVGHGLENMPLPLGAKAVLCGDDGTLRYLEGIVAD